MDYLLNIPDNFTITDGEFLEMLLLRIRGESIKFASFQKRQTCELENKLVNEIAFLEANQCPQDSDTLEDKKKELEKIRDIAIQGTVIRSRAQWLNEGERPSKYFCSLEKYNYTEKTIRCVQLDSGKKITDQKDILKEVQHFYSKLFSAQNNVSLDSDGLESIIVKANFRKLNHLESASLEGELKLEELSQVLLKMKNNKCPGVDGFPAEFFKVFWGKLKYFVLRALNFAYTSGKMSISMRTCIISCLPKGDKPREFLKNWRPVSLLSVVYKMASAAIANRLKSVLPKLVSKAQTGFLEGRFIGDSTRLVYDIMQYLDHNNLPGQLMLIDFRKAFDSVSWVFLYKLLKLLKFDKSFCKWITIFNNDIKASVLQSGFLSHTFNIERGCRQGDPISSYLFLLCAQVLFCMVDNNIYIKGISLNNINFKMTQFADDTTLFLDGSKDSLVAALNTLEIFGSLSGLKVNTEKTKIIWLGRKKHSRDKFEIKQQLDWGTTKFKLLGLIFSVDIDDIPSINYTTLLNDIAKILSKWRRRNLTPIGKISIVKTFVISSLNHLLSSIPSPSKQFISQLNQLMYSFIWDDKPHKISKRQITNNYIEGGLQMINIENYIMSQKLVWIKRLFTSESPWVKLLASTTNVERLYNFGPLWSKYLSERTANIFWKEVFNAWYTFLTRLPVCHSETLTVPLWYNFHISTELLFYPHWCRVGINTPLDILKPDGSSLSMFKLRQIFGLKTNFPEHLRVQRCLKDYLLKFSIKQYTCSRPVLPSYLKVLLSRVKGLKYFYKTLNDQYKNLSLRNKWNNVLNTTINDDTWNKIFKNCFKTICRNDLIWLQFRIIHRILGTRAYLQKINITVVLSVLSVSHLLKQFITYLLLVLLLLTSGEMLDNGFNHLVFILI